MLLEPCGAILSKSVPFPQRQTLSRQVDVGLQNVTLISALGKAGHKSKSKGVSLSVTLKIAIFLLSRGSSDMCRQHALHSFRGPGGESMVAGGPERTKTSTSDNHVNKQQA